MLPAFKNHLTASGISYVTGKSNLNTTGDLLCESLRLLRRKDSNSLPIKLLKDNLYSYNNPVLLFVAAATAPNPFRSAGGFYGDSYVTEKDRGSMEIRSFVLLYKIIQSNILMPTSIVGAIKLLPIKTSLPTKSAKDLFMPL